MSGGRKLLSIIYRVAAVIFFIAAPFALAAFISILSNKTLEVARYELKSAKLVSPLRIVMISDLHRRKLDAENQQLVDKTDAEKPDLIFVNGDMLEPDYSEVEAAAYESLLRRLNAVAPVYFSAGNHDFPAYFTSFELAERELLLGTELSPLVERLEGTGARFLERDYIDISVNTESLRIGGMYAFAYKFRDYTDEQFERISEFLADFLDTEGYTIMLSHRPDSFAGGDAPDWSAAPGGEPGIDLILSGHTHNGVIALPFGLGALWCSSEFFPEYDRGLFDLNGTLLIIGGGLDGYKGYIPRVFNPPEIVAVDILPESPSR